MRPIDGKVFAHVAYDRQVLTDRGLDEPDKSWDFEWEESGRAPGTDWVEVDRLRASSGYPVRSFRRLVELVAELGYRNYRYNLLFRGQGGDWGDRFGKTTVYSTIFRPPRGKQTLPRGLRLERFARLDALVELLRERKEDFPWRRRLHLLEESHFSILQHYELCETPMIDLTNSLRVAVSFALDGDTRTSACLLVFGLPHPTGSISHFVDEQMTLVKLQNMCPPEALRPHFQQGWLVARLPWSRRRETKDNLANRLIGKYRLDNADGQFWGPNFAPVPNDALLPPTDEFGARLRALAVELDAAD